MACKISHSVKHKTEHIYVHGIRVGVHDIPITSLVAIRDRDSCPERNDGKHYLQLLPRKYNIISSLFFSNVQNCTF